MHKDLPTSNVTPPRITKAQQAEILANLSAMVEVTPLNTPIAVATAYMQGVPMLELARWFRVPTPYMRDFVNTHLIGNAEVARLKKEARAEATATKRAAAMLRHPSSGNGTVK